MLDLFTKWLQNVVAVGGPSTLIAYALFKWFGQKWIEQRLSVGLEKFKAMQQRQLEEFKADQQIELERLRHLLSSRISKIHEKEFEVLPKAWLMLHELHGSVAIALGLTMQYYPNFKQMPDAQFEEFLTTEFANRLSPYQKTTLRNTKLADRTEYFIEAMEGIYLDDANNKLRVFKNYLIEHSIFMTDELRKVFNEAHRILASALVSYSVGKDAKNREMEMSGMKEGSGEELQKIIETVEEAVQKRLHYEDA